MDSQSSENRKIWLWKLLVLISSVTTFAAGLGCYLWLFESLSYPLRLATTLMVMALVTAYGIIMLRKLRETLGRAAGERESRPR